MIDAIEKIKEALCEKGYKHTLWEIDTQWKELGLNSDNTNKENEQ